MRFGEEWSGATTTTASSMNWSRECGGGGAVNRSVSADALTDAMMGEGGGGAAAAEADELTAASDSELPTAIGRAMNGAGADATRGGGGQSTMQQHIRNIFSPVFARARDF